MTIAEQNNENEGAMKPYLRATKYFPRFRALESSPPVEIRKAWNIHTPGIIGAVLDTPWGYRAAKSPAGDWVGCWYTSRDMCRDTYVNAYEQGKI